MLRYEGKNKLWVVVDIGRGESPREAKITKNTEVENYIYIYVCIYIYTCIYIYKTIWNLKRKKLIYVKQMVIFKSEVSGISHLFQSNVT